MSEMNQPIFKRAYSEELREKLAVGESIASYLEREIDIPPEAVLQSTLLVDQEVPELSTEISADVDNAIKVYEYLQNLDKTQASDKRLWIYLSHVTFRDYTQGRWSLKTTPEDLAASSDIRQKAINYIAERWFLTGNARSLRRHSIARLWWAAYVTVAPWEKDPAYFSQLESADKYIYTKIVFANQDVVQQVLERRLGWSDRMLIAILEYLRQHPEVVENREEVRTLMKELNLMLGYRKLSLLNFDQLLVVITEVAQSSLAK